MKLRYLFISSLIGCSSFGWSSLIYHSTFDHNANDISGYGNHGQIVGNPTFVSSPFGTAIEFNNPFGFQPANQYVKLPNSVSIRSLETSSFTLQFRIWTIDSAQQNGRIFGGGWGTPQIVFDYNAQLTPGAHGQIHDNQMRMVSLQPQASSNPNMIITDGVWRWVSVVLNRNTKTFSQYHDKVLVAQTSFTELDAINFPELYIGAVAAQIDYGARQTRLDDVAMFNRALTQEEIDETVDRGVVPEPCTLLGIAVFIAKRRRKAKRTRQSKNLACSVE